MNGLAWLRCQTTVYGSGVSMLAIWRKLAEYCDPVFGSDIRLTVNTTSSAVNSPNPLCHCTPCRR